MKSLALIIKEGWICHTRLRNWLASSNELRKESPFRSSLLSCQIFVMYTLKTGVLRMTSWVIALVDKGLPALDLYGFLSNGTDRGAFWSLLPSSLPWRTPTIDLTKLAWTDRSGKSVVWWHSIPYNFPQLKLIYIELDELAFLKMDWKSQVVAQREVIEVTKLKRRGTGQAL